MHYVCLLRVVGTLSGGGWALMRLRAGCAFTTVDCAMLSGLQVCDRSLRPRGR